MTLLETIEAKKDQETRYAICDQIASLALMYTAIGTSGAAAICGFSKWLGPQALGAIALIPGFLALVATTLKFDARSQWHYEKRDALDALARRLEHEIPQPPDRDDLAAISRELTKLNADFNKTWYAKITISWDWVKGGHKS